MVLNYILVGCPWVNVLFGQSTEFRRKSYKVHECGTRQACGKHIDYPTLEPTTGRNSIFVLTNSTGILLKNISNPRVALVWKISLKNLSFTLLSEHWKRCTWKLIKLISAMLILCWLWVFAYGLCLFLLRFFSSWLSHLARQAFAISTKWLCSLVPQLTYQIWISLFFLYSCMWI